jgi:hypothetical protein
MSLWQEQADNFYPERADFMVQRYLGEDFASNLMTSFPVICRRDLGNQIGSMLRPNTKNWFKTAIRYQKNTDNEVRQTLQMFQETQRRAMYDKASMFTRATKEADHDFACFGQAAISSEIANNPKVGPHLLYRCWHLRDMAWQENEYGKIGFISRRWKPTALTLSRTFPGKIHRKVEEARDKDPFKEFNVIHIVCEADMYNDNAKGRPYWSIWYDCDCDHLIEAVPQWTKYYTIPRWQTVSGSQYSYSPATVAALPDARLIQAMTFTLLEAGEKATSPPLIATKDAVRSDVAVYAGGITWVDADYDENLGEVLRPITQDFRGISYGMEMNQNAQAMITEAFFLNKLRPFNPAQDPQMTAFQAGQIVQEYIRNALPIFEPMEMEYNAELCDQTFELLWRKGAFGSPLDWPKKIQGADIEFTFESPLHDAIEQQKGQIFLQASQLLAQAVAIDPSVSALPKVEVMLRDAVNAIGVPATWLHSEAEVEQAKEQEKAQQQAAQILGALQQGSEVVKNVASTQQPVAVA